jgi:hypothetical protein
MANCIDIELKEDDPFFSQPVSTFVPWPRPSMSGSSKSMDGTSPALAKNKPTEAPKRLPDAPVRESFQTTEEFEEAMGYWQSHVGRIKAMAERAKA